MHSPRLPSRLHAVLDAVPGGARRVADVGAGHGALSVHLAHRGRTVIATEATAGPYHELRRNLQRWHAAPPVEHRLGPGLQPLRPGEVDTVVIAGMGARTAVGICAEAAERGVRWLVVQCMQDDALVEPALAVDGWTLLHRRDVVQRRHAYAARLFAMPA